MNKIASILLPLCLALGLGAAHGANTASKDEAMAMVKKHEIDIESGPFAPSPKTKFFYVRDPDGMHIQFVQQTR